MKIIKEAIAKNHTENSSQGTTNDDSLILQPEQEVSENKGMLEKEPKKDTNLVKIGECFTKLCLCVKNL